MFTMMGWCGVVLSHSKVKKNTILQKWSPYWDDMSRVTFGWLPWRSWSQHNFEAKSYLAHNFSIWSRILQLFHRNDHQIETTCRAKHLGRYLEGQDHSITLQQNRVRPITSLFTTISQRNDQHIETMCRAQVLR
jgi:hypothetical protein